MRIGIGLREGIRALWRHPLRSLLTAATSAVAIAVTVNVISLVYGLDEDIRRDAGRFGRRTVDVARLPVILPGMKRERLGPDEKAEVEALLEGVPCQVVTRRLLAGTASRVGEDVPEEKVAVVAVPPTYLSTLDVPLAAGRFFRRGDAPDAVCVVDESVSERLFPDTPVDAIPGREIRLRTGGAPVPRSILGVVADPLTHRAVFDAFDESRGARALTSALLSFRNVYVPQVPGSTEEYSGISVAARTEDDVDEIARRLGRRWPVVDLSGPPSASGLGVFVRRDWMDLLGASSQTGAFLSNIVWIIIVGVAVVMVSTLDLLCVRERYDELAVRRVEGARRGDVAWQVTVEGVVLAVLGGLAGLPLGFAGAALLREIVDFPFRFEVRYAIAATGVAALLGLVASVLPARHAASLQPVRVLTRRRS